MNFPDEIRQEQEGKARAIQEAVVRYRRLNRNIDAMEEELERLQAARNDVADEVGRVGNWLIENMGPDDYAAEFGYYPDGKPNDK